MKCINADKMLFSQKHLFIKAKAVKKASFRGSPSGNVVKVQITSAPDIIMSFKLQLSVLMKGGDADLSILFIGRVRALGDKESLLLSFIIKASITFL